MILPRHSPAWLSLLVGCNEVAGIDSPRCAPACADSKTQLVCDDRGEPVTRACPESTSACAEAVCTRGACTFEPAPERACGYRSRGACGDGFACIGPDTTLTANRHHTCLGAEDGQIWCWGENAHYELGDGTTSDRGSPVPVRDLPGEAIRVSAGFAHTCAVLRDGSIACWGSNDHGQCGTGTATAPLERPETVPMPDVRFTAVTAGRAHTCALTSQATVYCWGNTSYGQAGVDPGLTTTPIVAPTPVEGLDSVFQLETVEDHTCATRTRSDTFVCWGSNVQREGGHVVHKLGPRAAELQYSAAPVGVELPIAALGAPGVGPDSTYAKTADHGLTAWGLNATRELGVLNAEAIVAAPSVVSIRTPNGTQPLRSVDTVLRSAGAGQCASVYEALRFTGTFLCWGENDHGELGLGQAEPDAPFPDAVRTLPLSSRRLVRGQDHVCALVTEAGREEVRCYGAAHLVGNGTTRAAGFAIQWQAAALKWNPDHVPVLE